MNEIISVFASWQFVALGVFTGLIMLMLTRLSTIMWRVRKIRRGVCFCNAMKPLFPAIIGGVLGLVPSWPRPEALLQMPNACQAPAMVVLGLIAGSCYERIWKSVKQVAEARGVDLSIDLTPKEQQQGGITLDLDSGPDH